jgi:PAS domain S-box-containing protein
VLEYKQPDLAAYSQAISEQLLLSGLRFQEQAEQAELGRRETLAVLDSVLEGIVSVNADGCCTYVNPVGARLLGYAAEDLLGRDAAVLFRPGLEGGLSPAVAVSPIAIALESGQEIYVEVGPLWRQDGTAFAATYSVSPTNDRGGRCGAVLTFRDSTARQRIEQRLAQQVHLQELAHDAIIIRDPGGIIAEWNRGAEELFGWTNAEAAGQSEYTLLRTRFPQSREALDHALETTGRWDGELTHTRRDGTDLVVESRQVLLRDAQGTPIAILEINRDLTERRALERLQQEFIANVSHELRNPLAAIRGYVQLMQRRNAYDQQATEIIVSQTGQLDRMIGDLLDAARLGAGRLQLLPEPVDLVALVQATVAQAQGQTELHRLRVEAPARPLIGSWDPGRLEQVLQNLLSNAVKYSPNGGEVLISVRDLGDQAQVAVTDAGAGIPRELLPKLFGRFYRTEAARRSAVKGVGVGLYIAKSLVEAHGGQIVAESTLGHGSTFRFTVPLTAPAAP